ncbi:hypothetical protein [Vibrio parahaemolyticus]|uniref:hypothetical protein n=1 Tax=Vibrio parahaemolyticus TaxID=670 RepID=UPI00287B237D|nr:hypothetical protein [Vibrio parahaemolyticus]MDS1924703.1 hypothetical protein [Vibrio parahaemolyticus]
MPAINQLHSELWYIHGSSLSFNIPNNTNKLPETASSKASITKGFELEVPWYDHGDFTVLWRF